MQSLQDPLWPRVVAPDRVQSISQIVLSDIKCVHLIYTELFEIELFNHLSVCN